MENISLRRISLADNDRVYEWVKEPWYTQDFAGSSTPTRDSHDAYFEKILNDPKSFFLAVECNGKHIGNAGIKNICEGEGEIWYYIGDMEYRGRGLAKQLVAALIHFSKKQKEIDKLCARVLETNTKSIRALAANGFRPSEEGFGTHDGVAMLRYELIWNNPKYCQA